MAILILELEAIGVWFCRFILTLLFLGSCFSFCLLKFLFINLFERRGFHFCCNVVVIVIVIVILIIIMDADSSYCLI